MRRRRWQRGDAEQAEYAEQEPKSRGAGGHIGSTTGVWKAKSPATKTQAPEVATDDVSDPVVSRVCAVAAELQLRGRIQAFGSHINGLFSVGSDCDLSYMPTEHESLSNESAVAVLQRFAQELPKHGFHDVISVMQANVPLVKAIDRDGAEVDLCYANLLGYQNSRLVAAYCAMDKRVSEVGRMVKQWAKAFELVGSSDGHLNSYAYTLLTIYYMMNTTLPVVPNLQDLAIQEEPNYIRDERWGHELDWDCKFWEQVNLLPRSTNKESSRALLCGFFEYYTSHFDWQHHAVSVRLARTSRQDTSKFDLQSQVHNREHWYIEDPFDLKHNLASQTTKEGRRRILDHMERALDDLRASTDENLQGVWQGVCTRPRGDSTQGRSQFLLKCRVNPEKVSAAEFVDGLRGVPGVGTFTVRYPSSSSKSSRFREVAEAFALFGSDGDRRRVQSRNESCIGATRWQLRLLTCSSWALEDAVKQAEYEEIEVRPPSEADEADRAGAAVPKSGSGAGGELGPGGGSMKSPSPQDEDASGRSYQMPAVVAAGPAAADAAAGPAASTPPEPAAEDEDRRFQ